MRRRVQRKLLTILFGQSGLGKTSILRAGIVPRLRPEGYCPVYVRIDYSRESPPSRRSRSRRRSSARRRRSGQWTQTGVAVSGESLWEFLHHRDDVLRDASGRTLIPLLIFDQFEEIFTLAQSDDFGRRRAAQFLEDLADLVENRAPKALEARIEQDEAAAERFDFTRGDYRILIALREDYLAHLEGVKGDDALDHAEPDAARADDRRAGARRRAEARRQARLRGSGRVDRAFRRRRLRAAATPRSSRRCSSLICRELNNARIAQGRSEISADLLAGSRDTILTEFYERALADQPPGVRKFIEDEMLTESGFRESLAEERVRKAFAAAGAPPDTLAKLVDRRLLRIEERLDLRRVELTHDVLCSVVEASRDLRYEREARDEAERQLAAQRARELATRKALVRARQIAAVCAVLAIGAAGQRRFRLRQHEARAGGGAQGAADAPDGRDRARRSGKARSSTCSTISISSSSPSAGWTSSPRCRSARSITTRRCRRSCARPRPTAIARWRWCAMGPRCAIQSKLDESGKALAEAVGVLSKLRKEGDQSEATADRARRGLDVAGAGCEPARTGGPDERVFAMQAVDVLKPLMAAPNPSIAAAPRLWSRADLSRLLPGQHRRGRGGGCDAGGSAQNLSAASITSSSTTCPRRSRTRKPPPGK